MAEMARGGVATSASGRPGPEAGEGVGRQATLGQAEQLPQMRAVLGEAIHFVEGLSQPVDGSEDGVSLHRIAVALAFVQRAFQYLNGVADVAAGRFSAAGGEPALRLDADQLEPALAEAAVGRTTAFAGRPGDVIQLCGCLGHRRPWRDATSCAAGADPSIRCTGS